MTFSVSSILPFCWKGLVFELWGKVLIGMRPNHTNLLKENWVFYSLKLISKWTRLMSKFQFCSPIIIIICFETIPLHRIMTSKSYKDYRLALNDLRHAMNVMQRSFGDRKISIDIQKSLLTKANRWFSQFYLLKIFF